MINLSFQGAINSVGASAILVDTGVEKIVLDYGTKPREIPPIFPIPFPGKPDYIFCSHAHLDHAGALPLFEARGNTVPIYSIEPTRPLVELLLLDSVKITREEGVPLPFTKDHVHTTIKNFVPIEYRKPLKLIQTKATAFNAGHIIGSMMVFLDFGNKSLLYTGDFNTVNTRLLPRADEDLPKVDYLITESTYSDREHPDRKSQEKELVKKVNETIGNGGKAIIAGFAVSRLQEVLVILDKHGIDYPIYMDGMGKKATTITNQYSRYLSDPAALNKALEKLKYVHKDKARKKIVERPGVILTTSGMLTGGPVINYLKRLHDDPNSSLILTGYQLEGTPGKILLETGMLITEGLELQLKMQVKRFDFSGHAGRSGLFEFIEKINPEKVFCIHGDHTEEFVNELKQKGLDAIAPVANNRIFSL